MRTCRRCWRDGESSCRDRRAPRPPLPAPLLSPIRPPVHSMHSCAETYPTRAQNIWHSSAMRTTMTSGRRRARPLLRPPPLLGLAPSAPPICRRKTDCGAPTKRAKRRHCCLQSRAKGMAWSRRHRPPRRVRLCARRRDLRRARPRASAHSRPQSSRRLLHSARLCLQHPAAACSDRRIRAPSRLPTPSRARRQQQRLRPLGPPSPALPLCAPLALRARRQCRASRLLALSL